MMAQTDLVGVASEKYRQAYVLTNRLKWFTPFEILNQALVNNAELMSWSGPRSGMYFGRNEDWSETFIKFPQVLTIRNPTDGSYRTASMGWPGVLFTMTALNEHGAYLDIHDGTSMGGSVSALQRVPITCLLSDLMAEAPSLEAMVRRFNTYMPSASLIFTLADETGGASMECSSLAGCRVLRPEGEGGPPDQCLLAPQSRAVS